MQSQGNAPVKLLVSDMQKAQRLIEAMRDEIGSKDFSVSVFNGHWFLDWTGPNGGDFSAGSGNLDAAFVEAVCIAAEVTK